MPGATAGDFLDGWLTALDAGETTHDKYSNTVRQFKEQLADIRGRNSFAPAVICDAVRQLMQTTGEGC
jgi:hypothetical protein